MLIGYSFFLIYLALFSVKHNYVDLKNSYVLFCPINPPPRGVRITICGWDSHPDGIRVLLSAFIIIAFGHYKTLRKKIILSLSSNTLSLFLLLVSSFSSPLLNRQREYDSIMIFIEIYNKSHFVLYFYNKK